MNSRVALASLCGALAACDGEPPIDLERAYVLTGPEFLADDPEKPRAAGLLVADGRIVRLLDAAQVGREAAHGIEMRRLPGRLAVPGLVDAHAHVLSYGLARSGVDLVGAATLDEALDRVRRWAGENPDARWIVGRGWDHNDWPAKAWPTADALEEAVPGRPCALQRIDGHAIWVNRTAMARARLDDTVRDPRGGRVLRDAKGRPSGVLIDAATQLVEHAIPPPGPRRIEQAYLAAARDLAARGLTGVHDMGLDAPDWDVLVRLSADGRFPLRIDGYASAESGLHERLLADGPVEAGRVRLVGVKLYADGALGSRGARLIEPYSDEPTTRGLWVTPPEQLERLVAELARAGVQPAIHAIGDAANRAVLDAYASVMREVPALRELRPRIEHVQVVAPDDVRRFAELGVVASVQPTHATSDMPWAESRLGPERVRGAYAWRTLLDAGARLALGSDFPVESIDPRLGVLAAVTRADPQGRPAGGWRAEQALTLAEALAGFSSGAAWAVRRESELGRIAPGYLCDLTVFEADITRADAARLHRVGIAATVIGGEIVPSGGAR